MCRKNAAIAAFVRRLHANMVNTKPLRLFCNRLISRGRGTRMAFNATAIAHVRPALLIGSAAALLLAMTAGLWAWYGTTVFFEMVRTGWSACF